MSGGPLAGIRVVDLTTVVVGPTATLFLADYGADVIKVEAPAGDLLRSIGGQSKSGQLSGKFTHFNRNKRSLALDLKRARRSLAPTASKSFLRWVTARMRSRRWFNRARSLIGVRLADGTRPGRSAALLLPKHACGRAHGTSIMRVRKSMR